MFVYLPQFRILTILLFLFVFCQSCSKDTDLISNYVINEDSKDLSIQKYVVNDNFFITSDDSMLLDVLSNDDFQNSDQVTLTGTSTPSNGTVVINDNNTITYTPNIEVAENFEDSFTYTAEQVDSTGFSTVEQGSVSISNSTNTGRISETVNNWKTKFDREWNRSKSYYESETTGPERNGQRRYYDFRVIDGLIYMFQATGDLKYIEDFFWYVDRIKSIARPSTYHNDSFYDWEVPSDGQKVAFQLYDGHGLRNIFKMFWLLKKYPEVRQQSNFQEKYDEYLPWFTRNLWDKWKSRGNNKIMRGNTHMASHMASNMALYLYLIEDNRSKKDEYLSWVRSFNDNISAKWPNYNISSNKGFKDQLRLNGPHGGYVWSASWGNRKSTNDLTHTNAEVQAIINQYTHGIDWEMSDFRYLIRTANAVMDAARADDYADVPYFIDLKDNNNNVRTFSYGWAMLGRFDEQLQLRLSNFSVERNKASYYYNVYLGIMTLNRAYIEDNVFYPE